MCYEHLDLLFFCEACGLFDNLLVCDNNLWKRACLGGEFPTDLVKRLGNPEVDENLWKNDLLDAYGGIPT